VRSDVLGNLSAVKFRRAVLESMARGSISGSARAVRRLALAAALLVPMGGLAAPAHDAVMPPPDAATLLARGDSHSSGGDFDRAIADYDAALKADPKLAEAHHRRGLAWRAKGNRRRALADFDAALRLRPDFDSARTSRRDLVQEIERLGARMPLQPPAGK
jgi:tetratricopeptide (TPR) repeat protein